MKTCPTCGGSGAVLVCNIPFTNRGLWKECSNCNGTGDEYKGFERSESKMIMCQLVTETCGFRNMEYRNHSEYICTKCEAKHQ